MSEKAGAGGDTYIYELEWDIHRKRFFLGGPKDSSIAIRLAIIEVEAERSHVENWLEYLETAIDIFGRHGFVRLEP